MTRDEMKQLLARIDISYPNWKPKNLSLLIDTWFEMLGEYRYEDVLIAVKSFITTDRSGFAPSIGQVIGMMNDLKVKVQGDEISDMEAWAMVSRALRDSTYHATERFNEFPPKIKKAVGSPENLRAWGMDENYNENVAQSHFINTYHSVCESEKQALALPTEVRTLLTQSTSKLIAENN